MSSSERAGEAYGPLSRTLVARYVFALFVSFAVLLGKIVYLQLDDAPSYALLIGAVAVTVWYGGIGPGLLALAICWSVSLVLFVGEPAALDTGGENELLRWTTALVVGLAVLWVSILLRRGSERAARAVDVAVASMRELTDLQELAIALSAAVTPAQVAHALVEASSRLVGAAGAGVGLVEGDELVIADPVGMASRSPQPGLRLPLSTRTAMSLAVVEGRPQLAGERERVVERYPDTAALFPHAEGAIAVPLRVAGDVVGAIGLLFDDESADEDAVAVMALAAELGGQALERAQLYARERESRRALDRILRVAPRLHADSVEAAAVAICREARTAFGADLSMLWRRRGQKLELIWSEPASEDLSPGLEAALEDFPDLLGAVDQLQVSFVPNVQDEAQGAGLQRVRRLGIQSSLRTPIAIGGGEAELVLIVSWASLISEPDPSTIALMRRFADQAGFALEQVERRRAQAEAAVRADETRRLQEITAALSLASTATDVSNTCLEHALSAVGADAGFVVLSRPEGVTVDIVSSTGYSDDELEHWGRFALDADVPFARAIATGEAIWALTREEMRAFGPLEDVTDSGWASLPLRTAAGIRGALHLSFATPRVLTQDERRWLQAVVSQCAQALERSRLFDLEQLLRRRSERLQSMTAALSNALTRADVADVIVNEIGAAIGADGTALSVVVEERQLLRTVAWRGFDVPEDAADRFFEVPLDAATPGNRAVRRRVSAFYATVDELRADFPDASTASGHTSFLFVPLVAGRRTNGLLVFSWAEPYQLMPDEHRFVESLAGQAAQALDRATSFENEQTIAETLQRSVLPVSLPRVEGVQLAARYLPGTAELDVGGDWFDAISLPDGRLGLVVGDVVGKGVQAAATMAQLRNALRAFSLDRMKPSSAMARLNRLAEEVVETAFATVVYVVIDPKTRICRFTSAGHPPPLVAYPDRRVELLEGGRGLPLGAGSDTRYRHDVVELPIGSVLVLYSDGLVERRGRAIDEGLHELRRAALDGPREPEELVEHLLERMVGTGERGDDVALLAVRLLAVAPEPLRLRVPSDTGSLDLVRDALRVWLAGAPLSREDAQDVVLAVWEACANSIEHADDPTDDVVQIQADLVESRVRITVEDTGRWHPPVERADRGLGLQLMHSTMSSVDVAPSETGTRITLEKALTEDGG